MGRMALTTTPLLLLLLLPAEVGAGRTGLARLIENRVTTVSPPEPGHDALTSRRVVAVTPSAVEPSTSDERCTIARLHDAGLKGLELEVISSRAFLGRVARRRARRVCYGVAKVWVSTLDIH